MPPSRKPLEIDSGRIFRWSFVVIFLLLEWFVWEQVRQRPARMPGHRLLIVLRAPWATRRVLFRSMILAGAVTLAATLTVRLIVEPLLGLWLRPGFDPSAWTFHLPAGESPMASVPARWRSDGRWRPGALVLTKGRIWFMPAAWDAEPWSMARGVFDRVEAESSALARFLPIYNWPERLRFTARDGGHASFAVADPDAILDWFPPPRSPDAVPPGPRAAPQGVFDA